MDSEWIIGALALMTIGGVLVLSVVHFGVHVKDPKNAEAVERVAADRGTASPASGAAADLRPLRQRLNEAPGLDDSLSGRAPGLGPLDVLLTSKWSALRPFLGPIDRR